MKNKNGLEKQLANCSPGDLVCVDWTDASIGKSLGSGMEVDVPVKSWGVFVGAIGKNSKHIMLAQNNFAYMDGVYDIDYTAIPVAWTTNLTILLKHHLEPEVAKHLLNSFLMGGRRARSKAQQRIFNHSSE